MKPTRWRPRELPGGWPWDLPSAGHHRPLVLRPTGSPCGARGGPRRDRLCDTDRADTAGSAHQEVTVAAAYPARASTLAVGFVGARRRAALQHAPGRSRRLDRPPHSLAGVVWKSSAALDPGGSMIGPTESPMFARQQPLHLPLRRSRLTSVAIGAVPPPVDSVLVPPASPIAYAASRARVLTAALVWSPLHLRNARRR